MSSSDAAVSETVDVLPDWEPDLWEDYENADEAGRAYLYQKYGGPPAE